MLNEQISVLSRNYELNGNLLNYSGLSLVRHDESEHIGRLLNVRTALVTNSNKYGPSPIFDSDILLFISLDFVVHAGAEYATQDQHYQGDLGLFVWLRGLLRLVGFLRLQAYPSSYWNMRRRKLPDPKGHYG